MFKKRTDEPIRVAHDGAVFIFKRPTFREDMDIATVTATNAAEGIESVMSTLIRVENVTFDDGEEITAENVLMLSTTDIYQIFEKYVAIKTASSEEEKGKGKASS